LFFCDVSCIRGRERQTGEDKRGFDARRIQKRQKYSVAAQQIIDALRKLIIEYGSENVTVRRMRKEIGVSQGAI